MQDLVWGQFQKNVGFLGKFYFTVLMQLKEILFNFWTRFDKIGHCVEHDEKLSFIQRNFQCFTCKKCIEQINCPIEHLSALPTGSRSRKKNGKQPSVHWGDSFLKEHSYFDTGLFWYTPSPWSTLFLVLGKKMLPEFCV